MREVLQKYKRELDEMVEVCIRDGQLGYGASVGGNLSYRVEENPNQDPKEKDYFRYDLCSLYGRKCPIRAGWKEADRGGIHAPTYYEETAGD